jgi:hypothetical protein
VPATNWDSHRAQYYLFQPESVAALEKSLSMTVEYYVPKNLWPPPAMTRLPDLCAYTTLVHVTLHNHSTSLTSPLSGESVESLHEKTTPPAKTPRNTTPTTPLDHTYSAAGSYLMPRAKLSCNGCWGAALAASAATAKVNHRVIVQRGLRSIMGSRATALRPMH